METAPAGTWQRVVHLLRLGMLVIAMAGLVKASGAFTQAASFVMLLLDYLTH